MMLGMDVQDNYMEMKIRYEERHELTYPVPSAPLRAWDPEFDTVGHQSSLFVWIALSSALETVTGWS